ncbi:DUF7503 family protein [Candidatus Halobonum tyrrellensis]|nr:hypothetical protein [Candidatus Halobonum tyrrellensis]
MTSETTDATTNWLANHPKMMGVLFTAMLLLSNAGNAMAAASTTAGP